jgi:hypothetical protein
MRLSGKVLLLGVGLLLLAGHVFTAVGGPTLPLMTLAGEVSLIAWPIALLFGAVLRARGRWQSSAHYPHEATTLPAVIKHLHALLLLMSMGSSALASPLSDESAERVLRLLQPEQQHLERLAALDELNRRRFAEKIGQGKALSADQKEELETAVTTASRIIRAELAWTSIKDDLIRITKASLDEEEANHLLKGYPGSMDSTLASRMTAVQKKYHDHMSGRIDAFGPRLEAEIDRNLRVLRTSQLDGTGDPLAHLDGEWAITTIQVVAGQSKVAGCGLLHQPAHMAYQPNLRIELSAQCMSDGKYSFSLRRDKDGLSYFLTINSKEGINVEDFPVKYMGSHGWTGTARQVVGGQETALVAAIVPIEGKTWYGWASLIRPADDSRAPDPATSLLLRVDFTRRK